MIAPMTDGCNTMAGCNAGVKKAIGTTGTPTERYWVMQ